MAFILCLVAVRVLGIGLDDLERLSVFLIVLLAFGFLVVAIRPHQFPLVFRLEVISLGLNIVATFILMFGFFNT